VLPLYSIAVFFLISLAFGIFSDPGMITYIKLSKAISQFGA